MLLRDMTWQAAKEYLEKDDRIILPLGSVEQHGPIGLFGTDHIIPEAVAEEVASRTETVSAPLLCYGMSQHHMAFPGTMSLEPTTLVLVIRDLLVSLSRHGFNRILILNGHGGNIAPVQTAIAETCHKRTDIKIKFYSWWEKEDMRSLIEEMFGDQEGHHATPSEISMVMHLHRGKVHKREFPVQPGRERKYIPSFVRFRELFPDGSINSNGHLASEENGERIYRACVEVYTREMRDWE